MIFNLKTLNESEASAITAEQMMSNRLSGANYLVQTMQGALTIQIIGTTPRMAIKLDQILNRIRPPKCDFQTHFVSNSENTIL